MTPDDLETIELMAERLLHYADELKAINERIKGSADELKVINERIKEDTSHIQHIINHTIGPQLNIESIRLKMENDCEAIQEYYHLIGQLLYRLYELSYHSMDYQKAWKSFWSPNYYLFNTRYKKNECKEETK